MQRRSSVFSFVAVGLALLTAAVSPAPAEAAPSPGRRVPRSGGNFGIGGSLGDPLGFSLKYFFAPNHAVQADLGWAPLHHGDGRLGVDYLWHPFAFVSNSTMDFLPYFGVGLGVMFWAHNRGRWCYYDDRRYYDDRYYYCRHGYDRYRDYYYDGTGGAAMFIRAPILGLGFHWKKAPLDTMVEGSWSPYVIYPDLGHGDFSFKVRYYF